jgi:hypothetical protein
MHVSPRGMREPKRCKITNELVYLVSDVGGRRNCSNWQECEGKQPDCKWSKGEEAAEEDSVTDPMKSPAR